MKELLSPAGNMDCLRAAVTNGCDAVYISCKNFGARKFANNFDNEEILEAIKYCHLYNVRVYVTMNTLVRDLEVDDFINQARFLYQNGVDALIVQDFGMICLLREKFPNLEIHASTQANNSSYETCKLYYDLGVKRVVFSRELSIDDIDNINIPIEKEAFIHGALCISYSGCCLMSSMLGGRSGNRGECAGSCRQTYSLIENEKILSKDKYLLSTKELNTSGFIDRLKNSSIYSLKIEGRMKSPLYVGFITRFYRKLLDGEKINYNEELDKLKTIFNREFTRGRLFCENDKDIMNIKSPNHIGLKIGKCSLFKDKIKIELDNDKTLTQNDAIRFLNSGKGMVINYLYDKNMKLCNSSNNICYVDNKVNLKENDFVSITQSFNLEKEYNNISFYRKVKVNFHVIAHKGKKLEVTISCNGNSIKYIGSEISKAINSPINEESIIKQLGKLGNTPYILDNIEIEMDNDIFIQIRELNEVRRFLTEELTKKRLSKSVEFVEKEVSFKSFNDDISSSLMTCVVYSEDQLKMCLEEGFSRVYVRNKSLFQKYKSDDRIYCYVERCSYKYNNIPDKSLVSDYMYFGEKMIGNYTLNVTNIYTAYYLRLLGLKTITLSVELTDEEIFNLLNLFEKKFGTINFEVLKYGRVENMIIKGNILSLNECNYYYHLEDFKGRKFPVFFDGINTIILNHENYDKNNYTCMSNRYDFFDENPSTIIDCLKMNY